MRARERPCQTRAARKGAAAWASLGEAVRPKSRQNFLKRGETQFATSSARKPWANGMLWRTGAGRGDVVEVAAGEDDFQAHGFIICGICFAIFFSHR